MSRVLLPTKSLGIRVATLFPVLKPVCVPGLQASSQLLCSCAWIATNSVCVPGLQASISTFYLLTAQQNCLELCELGVAPRLVGLLSTSDRATRSYAILCLSAMATSGEGVCVMRGVLA